MPASSRPWTSTTSSTTPFFEVTGEKSGGKYLVKDVTTTMGVEDVATDCPTLSDDHYYTLSGQRVTPPLRRGIYLHKGKKIMVK